MIAAGALSSYACVSRAPATPREKRPYFVDGLSFLPEDAALARQTGMNAFIADVSEVEAIEQANGTTRYKRSYAACLRGIAAGLSQIAERPDVYRLVKTKQDLADALDSNKAAVIFQFQGAESVEDDPDHLDMFYSLGLRALQLTHHYGNQFAGGALDGEDTGLTAEGRALIGRLEEKSVLVDVSHAAPASALDVCAMATRPVVNSHGAARSLVPHARCAPDSVIRAVGDSGGVFGIFMMSFWLTRKAVPTREDYLNHLRHVSNIAGVEAAAIAHDFPIRETALTAEENKEMVKGYLSWWESHSKLGLYGFDHTPQHVMIPELTGPNRMERIWTALKEGGFASSDIEKIMGGNWLRVFRDTLPA